jgi:3-hydroxyisobutyrate dehydrogenase-like beta-hydroxyacid dehydrogenase
MGLPICARLARCGYRVVATDVDLSRRPEVRGSGARWAPTVASAAGAADVLLTVLPGSEELEAAMTEALPALRPDAAWIDLTSSSPAVREELAPLAEVAGVEYLEAPMGGGPLQAAEGALQLFVGAETSILAAHRPLLETLGRVEHVGGPGAGYSVKLLVNLLWFGQAIAVGEALLVAAKKGLNVETVRGALSRSSAASRFVDRDVDALFDGDYLTTFGLDRCCEELRAVVGLAESLGAPCELSSCVADQYEEALREFGPVDGELLGVALKERAAGITLRRDRSTTPSTPRQMPARPDDS